MTRPKGNRPVSRQNEERAKLKKKASRPAKPSRSAKASRSAKPAAGARRDSGVDERPRSPKSLREAMSSLRADPAADDGGAISPTRKWLAIGAGSVLATTAFWVLVFAVVAPDLDNPPGSLVPWYVLGGLGLPLTFATVAWISRTSQPLNAAAVATALATAVAAVMLGLGWLLGSALPLPAIAVFAFGAGGIRTLRMDDAAYLRPRLWAVLIAGIYSMVMLFVAPSLGISLATLFPFNALGLSDLWVDRRRARRGEG